MLNSFLTFLQRHGLSYLFFALLFVVGLSGCGIFRFEAEIVPLQPEAAVSGTPKAVSAQEVTSIPSTDLSGSSPLPSLQPTYMPTVGNKVTATPILTSYLTLSATYLTSEAEYNRMLSESSPTPTPTPFYAVAPIPQATNQLRFESRSMYQETPRFQITFDSAEWVVKETMLHHQYLTGCTLHSYSFWGQVRGPMQEEQVSIANITWTVRTFPTERMLSYVSATAERFTYVFHVTYDENTDDTTIAACRNAAEEVLKTFVVVKAASSPTESIQANEVSAQPVEGLWRGVPTYLGADVKATYPHLWQLQFDPADWHPENDTTLVYNPLSACQIRPTGGRGLSPNQTHENFSATLDQVTFEVTMVYTDGVPDFANYCTNIVDTYTCFQVSLQENTKGCRTQAEQVLGTLTTVERSTP